MSDDPRSEARALAREFARTLEHLREFRGVQYVGAAASPTHDAVPEHGVSEHAESAKSEYAESEHGVSEHGVSEHGVSEHGVPERGESEHAEVGARVGAHAGAGVGAERQPEPVQLANAARAQPAAASAPAVAESVPGQPVGPVPGQPSGAIPGRPSGPVPGQPSGPVPGQPSGPVPGQPSGPAPGQPEPKPSTGEQWPAAKKLAYLRERNVGDCSRCRLSQTRQTIVFGVGDPEADIMFIGEAPGRDEDRRGEPFVGAAGRRLDQWIERLGMRRGDVYIANVLKCWPPNNRDPQADEISRCSPFLHAQIRAVEPKLLIALGRFAGCSLLGRDAKLWEMRGKAHRYVEPKSGVEIPLVVTYHPAYVLRSERPTEDGGRDRPDRGGAIKTEDEKVMADLTRAVSLVRSGV